MQRLTVVETDSDGKLPYICPHCHIPGTITVEQWRRISEEYSLAQCYKPQPGEEGCHRWFGSAEWKGIEW
jgi:hypothetical protein